LKWRQPRVFASQIRVRRILHWRNYDRALLVDERHVLARLFHDQSTANHGGECFRLAADRIGGE
jgi:hypothetical protein